MSMKDKTTMLNQIEDQMENLADKTSQGIRKLESKVMDSAEYIQEKTYKGAHNLAKGTESLVENTLEGLNYIEDQLKHK